MATILVVDDEPTNRKLLKVQLGLNGHRVLEAENAREGLTIARTERPDLLAVDIEMPETGPPDGLLQQMSHATEPICFDRLDVDPLTLGLPSQCGPVRSFLGFPVASRKRRYGWIYFAQKSGDRGFTVEDQQVGEALAEELTVAYEHAVLFLEVNGIRQEIIADACVAVESKGSMRRRNGHHDWRAWSSAAAFTTLMLIVSAGQASGQTPQTDQSPSDLKKLSLDELQGIDVTSVSKHAEKLSTAPSSIQVITGEDIRRSGATSIPEALRLASNLQVAQVDSHSWAITARGFNSGSANKLLVLIDGRAVYSPVDAGVFWDVQDTLLEDIDRIEVISGPGGTLWGDNAVNGVINIITKSARDTQGVLVTGGAGSDPRGAGGVRYGGTVGGDVQFRAYGKYFDRNSSAMQDGRTANDSWNMEQGGFRLDGDASKVNHFTVQGDVYDGQIAQPGANDIAVSGGNLLGRWSHTFSKDADLSLQVYYDRTHRPIPGEFVEDLGTYDADFQHHFRLRAGHHVGWGLGFRQSNDHEDNTSVVSFLPAALSLRWFSGFVQDEMPLRTDRLRLTVGTKIEHNDYTGFEVEPSGRLTWTLAPRQTLWGAVSRAVRTPSRLDRDVFVPLAPGSTSFLLAGGPNFVSEDVLAYELGYRSEPTDRLSLTEATYYNEYSHIRSAQELAPPAPFPIVFANGQAGTGYGAEFTAEYRVTDWWRIRSGYTVQHLHIHLEPGSTDTSFASTEAQDPNQYGSLRQSLDLPAHLQLDLGLRGVGEIANQSVPAYVELDGRLAWQATPRVEFSINGQNLLHAHHAEFGAPGTRFEATRGVLGKLVWRF